MEILAIGNSFSQDASRYLHRIAKCVGEDLTIVNLYIGGCSLSRHYRNMLSKEKAYSLQFNGESTGFFVSLEEALLSRDWDFITLQQASRKSTSFDTYQPYIEEISSFVRMCCPKAKLGIHETWAYEQGSESLASLGYSDQKEMYDALHTAYDHAAYSISADFTIPSGTMFQKLFAKNLKIHRDTFHASLGIGRFALGLLWYSVLTGNDTDEISFSDFDEPISPDDIAAIKMCVKEAVNGMK